MRRDAREKVHGGETCACSRCMGKRGRGGAMDWRLQEEEWRFGRGEMESEREGERKAGRRCEWRPTRDK